MSLCVCDGPPHPYDPSWCVTGPIPPGSRPMAPSQPWGRANLRAPAGRDARERRDAIRRLDDRTPGTRAALMILGVHAYEFDT